MVAGVIELMQADCAIAISGIAGPGGGTPEKPVGTIWLAIGSKNHIKTPHTFIKNQILIHIRVFFKYLAK